MSATDDLKAVQLSDMSTASVDKEGDRATKALTSVLQNSKHPNKIMQESAAHDDIAAIKTRKIGSLKDQVNKDIPVTTSSTVYNVSELSLCHFDTVTPTFEFVIAY